MQVESVKISTTKVLAEFRKYPVPGASSNDGANKVT
ncbi:hypothetical protein SAMN05444272_1235 [Roseibium suaedae]|uniref:Uncharacterized protein n=1 Tax=Roseibium suaedae TaxID=735517 RepID=A0A1M7CPM4_9HYPH|nr:hypothetical protein SAMN05444272_1235 [Roseibium suaedae]